MSTENRGRREQHRERRSLGEKFQQWRQQRREWIAGMTRGQRIRHRLLQAAVVLAIAIIAVWAVMSAWIRVPKVPDPPTAGPDTTQQPGEGEDIQFTGAELPNVAKSGRKEGYYTFLVAVSYTHLDVYKRQGGEAGLRSAGAEHHRQISDRPHLFRKRPLSVRCDRGERRKAAAFSGTEHLRRDRQGPNHTGQGL